MVIWNIFHQESIMKYYQKAVSTPGIPYYTYEEMQQDLAALKAEYPAFLQLHSAGKSVEGRDITEVILGNIESQYHILIQASMHAREYMNTILVMKQMEDYLQQKTREYSQNQSCNRNILIQNPSRISLFSKAKGHIHGGENNILDMCLHIIPMVNPDGVTLCQNIKTALANPIVKTCVNSRYEADNSIRKWKANARGVDLNRNFDIGWASYTGAPIPCGEGYKGSFPASEPETQAILHTASKHNFVCCISYHSSGNLIYWDYGCGGKLREKEFALANYASAVTGYPLHSTIMDAAATAGCSDYFVLKLKIPAITIETGAGECPLKAEEYPEIYKRNKDLWTNLYSVMQCLT